LNENEIAKGKDGQVHLWRRTAREDLFVKTPEGKVGVKDRHAREK
jgi:hypothetical protein